MSPRRYRSDRRKAAAEQTRRRIVDSTAALHAERGVLGTTYAMIAERADVAVPTVYNHFPTRTDLLAACTGRAADNAPPLGPEIYREVDGVEARLRTLVGALFAYYRYYAPWMRWTIGEAPLVPELAALLRQTAELRRQLTEAALAPAFGAAPPAALVAPCEILLGFPAWQRLASDQALEPAEAEAVLVGALMALVDSHRAVTPAARRGEPRTKRKAK